VGFQGASLCGAGRLGAFSISGHAMSFRNTLSPSPDPKPLSLLGGWEIQRDGKPLPARRIGWGSYGLHLTGATSSGVPFLELSSHSLFADMAIAVYTARRGRLLLAT
jgi:hypothetical protein